MPRQRRAVPQPARPDDRMRDTPGIDRASSPSRPTTSSSSSAAVSPCSSAAAAARPTVLSPSATPRLRHVAARPGCQPRDPCGKDVKVYASGRANSRIQVFDENGKFLDAWPNIRRPYSLLMSKDQHLWVTDGSTQKVLKYDLTGKLLYSCGTFGAFPGGFWGVHQFHVDSEGSLYTADVHV